MPISVELQTRLVVHVVVKWFLHALTFHLVGKTLIGKLIRAPGMLKDQTVSHMETIMQISEKLPNKLAVYAEEESLAIQALW